MRGHIVGAFGTMLEQRVAIGHQAREEPLQIARDFRVGIFLNQKAGRRVPDENGQQPTADRTASNPCLNVTCDLDKTAARSLYLKHRVCLTHQRNLPC